MPQYLVCLSSWAGITYTPVDILERQPRRVKVRFVQDTVGHKGGSIGFPPYRSVGYFDQRGKWVPLARSAQHEATQTAGFLCRRPL